MPETEFTPETKKEVDSIKSIEQSEVLESDDLNKVDSASEGKVNVNESAHELDIESTKEKGTLSREQKIEEILKFKERTQSLLSNVRETRLLCQKYENENQYLQDYVGSLMKNEELK